MDTEILTLLKKQFSAGWSLSFGICRAVGSTREDDAGEGRSLLRLLLGRGSRYEAGISTRERCGPGWADGASQLVGISPTRGAETNIRHLGGIKATARKRIPHNPRLLLPGNSFPLGAI